MLSQIPADFGGCFLIAQHMPEGFTEMLANRLNENSSIQVHEARSGDELVAGQALICPGNRHLMVRRAPHGHIAVVSDSPRVNGHRPSADVLFRSVAKEFGPRAIALLMTGMGNDGAEAIRMVKDAGGLTLAQNSSSCVVDSMPRSAIERGHVNRVLDLEALPNFLYAQCAGQPPEQNQPVGSVVQTHR
jgi:two-component system, chemotaxis family, protein-glutamate methylesterase/glutaminase